MERKLRFIEAEILKENVDIPELTRSPPAPSAKEIIELEVNFFPNLLPKLLSTFRFLTLYIIQTKRVQ